MKVPQTIREKLRSINLTTIAFVTFLLFIFSLPFQKRIEFLHPGSFDFGSYIDYTTVVLYINDFLLVATLAFFVAQSILKRKMLSTLREFVHDPFFIILTIFLLAQAIAFSFHPTTVAAASLLDIALACSLAYLASKIVRRPNAVWLLFYAIILAGFYQSLIALSQFVLQHSVGLSVLGESPFDVTTLNVAKIVVDGTTYVRAYGTFPHPNVLASFLAVSTATTLVTFFTFREKILKQWSKTLFWIVLILVQFVAALLTFSRSGLSFLALLCGFFGVLFLTQNERSEQDVVIKKKVRIFFFLVGSLFFVFIVALWSPLSTRGTLQDSHGDNAISERALLQDVSRETIPHSPIVGTGPRSFLQNIQRYTTSHNLSLASWQSQPVHNIYLLIATESGLAGLGSFIVLIVFVLTQIVRGVLKKEAKVLQPQLLAMLCILGYLAVGLIDHHPWDIHQSLFTFFFFVGVASGLSDQ